MGLRLAGGSVAAHYAAGFAKRQRAASVVLSFFPLSHSGNAACMSQIFLSQPASQTAKKILMEGDRVGDELPLSAVNTCSEATLKVNDYWLG